MSYSSSIRIPVSRERVFSFFHDVEKLLRLNPQWAVIAIEGDLIPKKNSQFSLSVRYDRSENEAKYFATIDDYIDQEFIQIKLEDNQFARTFSFRVADEAGLSLIKYDEQNNYEISIEERNEINLWLRSIANYIMIQEKKTLFSKVWKSFLDKIWIKMSPTGKRVVLIIVFMELIAFIFFILLIIYLLIFKNF